MKSFFARNTILFSTFAILLSSGCSKKVEPPKPLAVEQAPTSLDEAFKNAKAEAKALAVEATAALQAKDYAKALLALQSLSGRSDLTAVQRDLASRAMLAVNKALSEQASTGDQKAQQVLQIRRMTK